MFGTHLNEYQPIVPPPLGDGSTFICRRCREEVFIKSTDEAWKVIENGTEVARHNKFEGPANKRMADTNTIEEVYDSLKCGAFL